MNGKRYLFIFLGGLATVGACVGEYPGGLRISAALIGAAEAAAQCPGRPPPASECEVAYCNTADVAWDYKPLPAGTSCRTNGQCDGQGVCIVPTAPPGAVLSDKSFYITGLGSRCVDFGGQAFWRAGAPVIIYGCNGSVAQQVRIKEIDATHDVELRVQSLYCIGVRGGIVTPGQPLELQTCNGSPAQRFAIDGDAILVGTQSADKVSREYVIEPEQGRTTARTPLAVGVRDLSDAEYFRFQAVDGSGSRPTSGFVRVSNGLTLDSALSLGWGTVIEVDDSQRLVLTGASSRRINAGVTLRGYRKFTHQGPEIILGGGRSGGDVEPAFLIEQDNVRVTGLRLRGRADVDSSGPEVSAIQVSAGPDSGVLLDHLDIGYWTGSAIDVRGGDYTYSETCPTGLTEWPRRPFVQAVGNFLHHNRAYGVVSGSGAFAVAQANVAYTNAHDIASDGRGNTGYAAYDNLVLTPVGGGHDFDVHGRGDPGHWHGGIAGDAVDIGWNTFLPKGHPNFNLRGTPCRFVAFRENLTQQSQGDAILDQSEAPNKVAIFANAFGASNPISSLAVGDFDGDGSDDVFVGSGVAWYFSSGGQAEWRFLNRKPERADQLRFGDFDRDGRTDVLTVHGSAVEVSWGGVSAWQTINSTGYPVGDLAVGDFDGDGYADVFLATGTEWFYAAAGRTWRHFAFSPLRTAQLRFGDFDGDRRTDVLGVVGGAWQMVPGNGQNWTPLRSALTSTLDGLVVADFDGDGKSDVAGTLSGASGVPPVWRYSKGARGDWTVLREFVTEPISGKPVGRFDGNRTADVILWRDLNFDYAPGGKNPVTPLSRQAMR